MAISMINPIGCETPNRRWLGLVRKFALVLALSMALGVGLKAAGSDAIAARSDGAPIKSYNFTLMKTHQPDMVRYRIAVENAAKRLRDLKLAPPPNALQ